MDKQSIAGFVLIGIVIMVWLYLSAPEPPKDQPQSGKDTTQVIKDTSGIAEQDSVPGKTSDKDPVYDEKETDKDTSNVITKPEEIVTLETELFVVELTSKGGRLKKLYLKEFYNWYNSDADVPEMRKYVQLLNYSEGGSFDLEFVTNDGKLINTADLDFDFSSSRYNYNISRKDSIKVTASYEVEPGSFINKVFVFYGNTYDARVYVEFINMHNVINNATYDVLWSNGIRFVEENTVDAANAANASLMYGDELVTVDAPHDNEVVQKEYNGTVKWLNVRNKYFGIFIAPDNIENVQGAFIKASSNPLPENGIKENYSMRLTMRFDALKKSVNPFFLYMGPVKYDILDEYQRDFISAVDFGSFLGLEFIVRPIAEYILLPLFNFLHSFIANYGLVIIVFSIIIKIVLYPLTKKSYKSMKRMQLLQPKIKELKEKYKDDSQKLNKETMKLYSTYGVNPAGGCLPLLLQMPIFVALWGLFRSAIELRQQPFFGWIEDLSRPDVIYTLPFALPLFGIKEISGLAILMGVTTFVQQKMSVKDPSQKAIVYIMPVMLTLLFMTFPSGLNLYYFMFNVLTIAQQKLINIQQGDEELQPVQKKKKQGGGFMQRLMDAAEQKAKDQQKRKR